MAVMAALGWNSEYVWKLAGTSGAVVLANSAWRAYRRSRRVREDKRCHCRLSAWLPITTLSDIEVTVTLNSAQLEHKKSKLKSSASM